ncbi:MAG: helix-turn-helix domain-containing protein [Sphingobium sp.]
MTSEKQDDPPAGTKTRNKGFEATHDAIIAAAVRLISEKGVDALSMAAISRAVGINRTTLYYHFDDREALIAAVKLWSSQQLGKGFDPQVPQQDRIEHISRFVLENAALIKLWLDDFVSAGDIRDRYPQWDALVEGTAATLGGREGEPIDAEVYCTILLTAAFIAPRVYHLSVRPDLPLDVVTERFRTEQQRVLRNDALYRT